MISKSSLWDNINKMITLVAPFDTTVLITGKTGTGKEVVARKIVDLSIRKDAPYFRFNCTQTAASLIDSELFGYEKGAFNEAKKCKPGRLELANGGTVLLDEIGDISEEMQVKLLRFMEEKEFIRVGGTKIQKVDVRIIAATSCNLEQMIDKGKFRPDLYYRLNRVRIHIPLLRERKEDIEPLTYHFIKIYCREYNKLEKQLSRRTLDFLKYYDWPGNVRELENMVSQAVLFSQSDTLYPEDFNIKTSKYSAEAVEVQNKEGLNLEFVEKNTIQRALSISKTKKEAATKLGISDGTLKNKMSRYNLFHVYPPKGDIPEAEVAKAPEDKEKLSPEQQRILDHINENGSINSKTACQMFGVARKTIVVRCKELMDKGLIIREGSGRSAKYIAGSGETALA